MSVFCLSKPCTGRLGYTVWVIIQYLDAVIAYQYQLYPIANKLKFINPFFLTRLAKNYVYFPPVHRHCDKTLRVGCLGYVCMRDVLNSIYWTTIENPDMT